jgi:hypothetical protein
MVNIVLVVLAAIDQLHAEVRVLCVWRVDSCEIGELFVSCPFLIKILVKGQQAETRGLGIPQDIRRLQTETYPLPQTYSLRYCTMLVGILV